MGRKVTREVWIADDDEEFETKEAMDVHEKMIPIVRDFTIYGSAEGCKIYWEDFWDWCRENPDQAKTVSWYINKYC